MAPRGCVLGVGGEELACGRRGAAAELGGVDGFGGLGLWWVSVRGVLEQFRPIKTTKSYWAISYFGP